MLSLLDVDSWARDETQPPLYPGHPVKPPSATFLNGEIIISRRPEIFFLPLYFDVFQPQHFEKENSRKGKELSSRVSTEDDSRIYFMSQCRCLPGRLRYKSCTFGFCLCFTLFLVDSGPLKENEQWLVTFSSLLLLMKRSQQQAAAIHKPWQRSELFSLKFRGFLSEICCVLIFGGFWGQRVVHQGWAWAGAGGSTLC